MKRFILILTAVLFFGLQDAQALTVVNKDAGYISVNATAEKDIVPDTATIFLSVNTSAPDSKSAVNKNKEISSKLINSIKPLLAIDKADTIQTKSFTLKPVYRYEKNGKKTFVNYSASNVVCVKTKNLDNISTIIDTATVNGATNINGLNFYVENEQEFAAEITKEALSKAKTIAELSANNMGQKIKDIKTLKVTIYPQNSVSPYRALSSDNSVSNLSKNSTPVEFGKIKLESNVYAEFYVK